MEVEMLARKLLELMPKCDPLEQTIKIGRFILRLRKRVREEAKRAKEVN